jgi:hypothetical protein
MEFLEAQRAVNQGILFDLKNPSSKRPVIGALVDDVGLSANAFGNSHLRYMYQAAAEEYIESVMDGDAVTLNGVLTRLESIYRYNGHQHNAGELLAQWRGKIDNLSMVNESPLRCARILRNYHIREKIVKDTQEFLRRIHSSDDPQEDIADFAAILANFGIEHGNALNIKSVIAAEGVSIAVPETTGYARLDGKGREGILAVKGHEVGGYVPGRLVIMVGQPGAGKSTVAINLAARRAERHRPVVFHSFEMDKPTIYRTMVCCSAGCTHDLAFRPEAAGPELEPSIKIVHELLDKWVRVYDEPTTLAGFERRVRRHQVEYGDIPVLHILDHIGAFVQANTQAWQQVGNIARDFHNAAKENNACILALSHPLTSDNIDKDLKKTNRATTISGGYGGRGTSQWADVIFLVGRHNGQDEFGMFNADLRHATIFQGAKNRQGKGMSDSTYFVLDFDPQTEYLTDKILIDDQDFIFREKKTPPPVHFG